MAGTISDLWQHRHRHIKERAEISIPFAFFNIIKICAAGIGGIGEMMLAACQAKDKEAINGAKA